MANRILIVLALGRGQSASLVADMFLIDSDTVRRYFRLYQEGGINGLLEIKYEGRTSFLTDAQKEQLKQHLRGHIYLDVKPIIVYVFETFGVYSIQFLA
jgi:transposase